MALYIGIDPGKTGAIAVMDADDMSVRVFDMPGTMRKSVPSCQRSAACGARGSKSLSFRG
jgi:hypothetical protein